MRGLALRALVVVLLSLQLGAAALSAASQGAGGDFRVLRPCEAYRSFRKATNPGMVKVGSGERYPVVEVDDGERISWVRVRLGDEQRWVSAGCGVIDDLRLGRGEPAASQADCSRAEEYDSFVLALTWQPGFCEHVPGQERKRECRAMAEGSLAVSHLTLHGLWPNSSRCGTSYGHCPAEDIALSAETLAAIRPFMPNFHFEDSFGNYQWKKHGACQRQLDDDGYFRRAVDYVRLVNDSPLGAYIAANIGGTIDRERFYDILRGLVGKGARARVDLLCAGGHLYEIRLRLPRQLGAATSLVELLGVGEGDGPAGPRPFSGGCPKAIAIEASGR